MHAASSDVLHISVDLAVVDVGVGACIGHASLLAKVTDVVSEARPLVAHKVVGGAAQELVDVAEAHLARKGGGALLGDGYRSGQGEGESVAKVHPAREGGRALQRVGVLEGASRDEGQG